MSRLHDALNAIRDEVNLAFGFLGSTPRINNGPCGLAARIFREAWCDRFGSGLVVAFVMNRRTVAGDISVEYCSHVLLRLPDGCLFDLGCGVLPSQFWGKAEDGESLQEMAVYDEALLRDRSYGFDRWYPLCPDFDAAKLRQIVTRGLSQVASDAVRFQSESR